MERNDMKRNVFISYSRRDYVDGHGEVIPGNSISRILEALENNGITYWIDKQGIYSGDEFKGLLTQAIMDADVFVFVSSEAQINLNGLPRKLTLLYILINALFLLG